MKRRHIAGYREAVHVLAFRRFSSTTEEIVAHLYDRSPQELEADIKRHREQQERGR